MTSTCRLLALDIGGVLFADPMPRFFAWLAAEAGVSPGAVGDRHGSMRERFWSGRISTAEYWRSLREAAPVGCSDDELTNQVLERMQPTPTLERLAAWHDRARLALLSNHRHEWIEPLLERHVGPLVDEAYISSRTRLVKPDPAAFAQLRAPAGTGEVVYVDDQQRNLTVAAEFGMSTVLAVPGSDWHGQIDRWLES